MLRLRLLFAVILLSPLGCKGTDWSSLFVLESDAAGRTRLVAGSLESVSRSTQGTLRQLGLKADVRPDGDTVRIVSASKSGAGFTIVLTREKSSDSEKTRVRIEWDGAAEDQLGFQIIAEVASRGKS
jgi:hypothetical protein